MGRPLSIPPQELKDYIRKWAGKKSVYEMSKETGVNYNTIASYAFEMEISLAVDERMERAELIRRTIRQYHLTHTARQIAEMIAVPRTTILYRAWRMGIKIKRDTNNPVNLEPIPQAVFFNERQHENWIV